MANRFCRVARVSLLLKVLGEVVAGCAAQSPTVDPMEFVSAEISRGVKKILVPRAVYEIDTEKGAYFDLSGLDGVTIDFQGARLNGSRRTRMFNMADSTNVVLRNVTVDYRRLPFAEAVIESVDADRNWDVRMVEGYPLPGDAELARGFWPIQVYDAKTLELKNPMRYLDNVKIVRTGERTYRITGGIVASNVIEKAVGTGLAIYPEFRWLEGGCSRNVDILDNEIRSCGGEYYVGGTAPNGTQLGPEAHPGVMVRSAVE